MEGIDLARLLVGAMCCGMMQTGLATATAYVSERMAFGRPIADLQAVRFTLADVATDLEAARLLTYRAARRLQEGDEEVAVAAAHAKKFATRAAERRLADCMQVMGAAGARRDHPLPRHLAGSRLTHYMDGATEIQDVVISRSLLGS
jgi:alkylation response protein AidB-like acyl-CoA dehydrogenase